MLHERLRTEQVLEIWERVVRHRLGAYKRSVFLARGEVLVLARHPLPALEASAKRVLAATGTLLLADWSAEAAAYSEEYAAQPTPPAPSAADRASWSFLAEGDERRGPRVRSHPRDRELHRRISRRLHQSPPDD